MMRKTVVYVVLVFSLAVPAMAQDYAEIDVKNGASIHGRISLDGKTPAPLRLLITKDVEVCGLGYRERVEVDVDENNGLRNVVVYIEDIVKGKAWNASESEEMNEDLTPGSYINQEACRFQPHIQVIRAGLEIDIINSDSTLHNIHAYELIGRARRSLFNISQPDMGPIPQLLHPRRGNRVSLECDSHDFMQGWVFAAGNPYATVVDDRGAFDLSDVPAGTYKVSIWHPRLGIQTQEITVSNDANDELNFEFAIE